MFANLIKAMPVIAPVAVLTGLSIILFPALVEKGATRGGTALGWAVGSALFGVIITAAYGWVAGRWPGEGAAIFLKLGILTFIGFTLLALVALPMLKMAWRIPIYTALHLIWAAGYGYFLPLLLK
jgi:hypothetical protein